MPRLTPAVTIALLSLILSSAASAETRPFAPVQDGFQPEAPQRPTHVPDVVLVQLTGDALERSRLALPEDKDAATGDVLTGLASLDALFGELGVRRISRPFVQPRNLTAAKAMGHDEWFRLDLAPGSDVPDAAERLAADAHVAEALPDLYVFPAAVPNDPDYPDNWGHENTRQLPSYAWGTTWDHTGPLVGTIDFDADAEAAWDRATGYGSPGVIIAIIDSGVDKYHPDLDQVTGWDYGSNDNDPDDDSADPGHGTACAGVAAAIADNALGVVGIAGGSRIMPLKVSNNTGDLSLSAVTNALYYAADNGADIASMSFGANTTTYAPTDAALQYAFNAGVTLLAATGNENAASISYPANNQYVIAVGAASPCGERKRSSSNSNFVNPGVSTDPNDYTCDGERWWGSNFGYNVADNRFSVDVLAPTILPTTDISGSGGYRSGDYEPFFNGTSCSTPYAAGVCALIKAANPSWTPDLIRDQLRNTATDVVSVESAAGWDRYAGYGLVNASLATIPGTGLPPVAAFSASPDSGCAPLEVTFTDQTSGSVYAWDWDFGDGATSTLQNPVHTYPDTGSYDVRLIATGAGGSDTLTVATAIQAVGPAPAGFTATPTSGPAPLTVTLEGQTTGEVIAWLWELGDGTITAGNPLEHTFTDPGTYSVMAVAINLCGNDTLLVADMIEVTGGTPPPTAAFSHGPAAGCVPFEVAFTDESTGDITGRTWHFGDGATDTAPDPVHEYSSAGPFDVSLIVFGPGGADTLTMPGLVDADTFVTASFTPSIKAGPNDPLDVIFTDTSTGGPSSWAWDFGDAGTDTVPNPAHSYTAEGTYTVSLTVGNLCGPDSVVETDLIVVRSPTDAPAAPARFALRQNYPNPFNPATTVAYSVAQDGPVRLEIFDAAGNRLDVLVDEVRTAGSHTVTWRPQSLASGVYFARLEADGQMAVRRLVLLR